MKTLQRESQRPIPQAKKRIQAILREMRIILDGGCVLRAFPETGQCGPRTINGNLILQFDHLLTRERNIAWNVELGVCVCLRHHLYYKKQYPAKYEECVRKAIGEKRCKLLDRAREDRRTYHMDLNNWLLLEIALTQDLAKIK